MAFLVIRRGGGHTIMSARAIDQARVHGPDVPASTIVLSCPLQACISCELYQLARTSTLGFFQAPRHLCASESGSTTVSCLPFFAYYCTLPRQFQIEWTFISMKKKEVIFGYLRLARCRSRFVRCRQFQTSQKFNKSIAHFCLNKR